MCKTLFAPDLMTTKKKISIGILTLVCLVMLLFAVEIFIMASSGKLFPVMEEAIGKTTEELQEYSPGLLSLLFTPIKALAALLMSFTIGILIMIYGPFRKNRKWASVCIFTMLFGWLISAFMIYYAQPNAPFMLWIFLLVLVVIALILVLTNKTGTADHVVSSDF